VLLQPGHLQHRRHRRAIRRVVGQQALDQGGEVGAVALGREGGVGAAHDLVDQAQQVARIKGVLQHGHLVQHAPQGPQVRLVRVRNRLDALGGHVKRLQTLVRSWSGFGDKV
jgi:hypothetical protein